MQQLWQANGLLVLRSNQMNRQSTTPIQHLKVITKNCSMSLGCAEEIPAQLRSTEPIQLELDFNKPTFNYH